MKDFDANNWYWSIGNDSTQVFSSARGVMVASTDPIFIAWATDGTTPSKIDTVSNLGGVLAAVRIRPTDPTVLAAYQQALASSVDQVLGKVLFNHENRMRALEAKQPVTAQQFTAALAALL